MLDIDATLHAPSFSNAGNFLGFQLCTTVPPQYQNYENYDKTITLKKTQKNAENGFSRGVSRATERFFFRQMASTLPDPTRTHAVGFILPLVSWLILFRASMYAYIVSIVENLETLQNPH
jgi:hypothetical protein